MPDFLIFVIDHTASKNASTGPRKLAKAFELSLIIQARIIGHDGLMEACSCGAATIPHPPCRHHVWPARKYHWRAYRRLSNWPRLRCRESFQLRRLRRQFDHIIAAQRKHRIDHIMRDACPAQMHFQAVSDKAQQIIDWRFFAFI